MSGQTLVLWDGDCGFCRRSVEWVLRKDAAGAIRAVPYQEAPSPPMTPELRAACSHAVHVITPEGRTLRAGRACLDVLGRIGFPFWARLLSIPPLVWAVEVGYWLVARNRMLASRFLFHRRS